MSLAAPPLLQAAALTRRFGGLTAVDAVTLDFHVGEIHAVIGTNGAGKSTLVNLLAGDARPSDGRVLLRGTDITAWPQPRRARAGLGRSFQRTTIFPEFSVFENARLCAQAVTPRAWRVWEGAAHCKPSHAAAWRALDAAGLVDSASALAGHLSHGQKRQLEIAMGLATDPRVLLLDEPLAGMGAEETGRMLELLGTLRATHAVLLVEHDMDAVFKVADRITVMVDGRVIASGEPSMIRGHPDVRAAYLGNAHA